MHRHTRTSLPAAIAAVVLMAAPIAAQTPAAAAQPAGQPQGPIVVEPIQNRAVFVPDVRVSEVSGQSATLVGGYGGIVVDSHLLVGGGGYWLANNARDRELYYLGGVVGWYLFGGKHVDIGIMSLIGAGRGTTGFTVDYGGIDPIDDVRFGAGPYHRPGYGPGVPTSRYYTVSQDLFIAEPSASVVWRLAKNIGIAGSVGYRFAAGAGNLNDEFQGVSGSVGIVFGGGK